MVIGLFGAAVTGVLTAFPRELVVAVARARAALQHSRRAGGGGEGRNAPQLRQLITFLVTLSGVTLAGIGSAFWGVVAGRWRSGARWRL